MWDDMVSKIFNFKEMNLAQKIRFKALSRAEQLRSHLMRQKQLESREIELIVQAYLCDRDRQSIT